MTAGAADYFTDVEARALIGRSYRNTAAYAGVPPGTVGRVTGVYPCGSGRRHTGVDVTWEGVRGASPLDVARGGLTDGFSRRDLYLVFTAGPNVGRRAMVPLDGPDGGPGQAGEAT